MPAIQSHISGAAIPGAARVARRSQRWRGHSLEPMDLLVVPGIAGAAMVVLLQPSQYSSIPVVIVLIILAVRLAGLRTAAAGAPAGPALVLARSILPWLRQARRSPPERTRPNEQASRVLADAPLELLNDPNYATVYERIAQIAAQTLGDASRVDVWDAYGQHAQRFWSSARQRTPELESFLSDVRLMTRAREIGMVLENRRAITIQPLSASTWAQWCALPAAGQQPQAVLIVPVAIAGLVRATITVVRRAGRPYDASTIALAEDFARRIAIVIVHLLRIEQTTAARLRAERGEQAKAGALTAFSHDMRTPLQAVNGYTQLLLEQIAGPLNGRQREYLQRIQNAQERLTGFVDRVLALARPDREHSPIDVRSIDLAAVARDVVALFAIECERKSLQLDIADCREGMMLRADPEKVARILQNLLSNAIKYTPAGGVVSLQWQIVGDMAEARVTDTGRGVSAGEMEAIFRPFYQVDRLADGSGLGLAISRNLARAMGGNLIVTSELGRGSTFVLRLPLAEPARVDVEPLRVRPRPLSSLASLPFERP